MALVLALYPGKSFYVGDTRVSVEDITNVRKFRLRVHGAAIESLFTITDREATEIMPNVLISAGNRASAAKHEIKVAIEAPKHIKILRESLYNGSK